MRKTKPLDILSAEKVKVIYQATLNILSEMGVRFQSERAPKLFTENGCEVDFQRRLVKFPPALVEEFSGKAPSSLHLRARNPKHDPIMCGNRMYFVASLGMRVADLDTGERHSPPLKISQANKGLKDQKHWLPVSPSSPFSSLFACAGGVIDTLSGGNLQSAN
jgi:trimethylamine:corrinoid methyltransferase-like protein